MTLTRRQFSDLRNSCLYKAAFKLGVNALIQAASMQLLPPRENVRRDRTKALAVYECPYCHCFHVGHEGPIRDSRPAFKIKFMPRKNSACTV